jgi:hypothetical protein
MLAIRSFLDIMIVVLMASIVFVIITIAFSF